MKIRRVVPKIWSRTDRHTPIHAHHSTPLLYRVRSKTFFRGFEGPHGTLAFCQLTIESLLFSVSCSEREIKLIIRQLCNELYIFRFVYRTRRRNGTWNSLGHQYPAVVVSTARNTVLFDVLTVFPADLGSVVGSSCWRRHDQSVERGQCDGEPQGEGPAVGQRADGRAGGGQWPAAQGRQRIQRPVRQVSARQGTIQEQGELLACSSSSVIRRRLWYQWSRSIFVAAKRGWNNLGFLKKGF